MFLQVSSQSVNTKSECDNNCNYYTYTGIQLMVYLHTMRPYQSCNKLPTKNSNQDQSLTYSDIDVIVSIELWIGLCNY